MYPETRYSPLTLSSLLSLFPPLPLFSPPLPPLSLLLLSPPFNKYDQELDYNEFRMFTFACIDRQRQIDKEKEVKRKKKHKQTQEEEIQKEVMEHIQGGEPVEEERQEGGRGSEVEQREEEEEEARESRESDGDNENGQNNNQQSNQSAPSPDLLQSRCSVS